ncbi:hypothetical protein AURDEDRAFT_165938 [Auricularia subglabra TFB-10046 SS5]|nr:hypothetical protein AURDEDRAFT_165938 [Auricularia subglabra TFB-10046 SS5]
MRICFPGAVHDNVRRVLDVLDGSPAESPGIVSFGDWIMGESGSPLSMESDIYAVVEALEAVTYNPVTEWHESGALGRAALQYVEYMPSMLSPSWPLSPDGTTGTTATV